MPSALCSACNPFPHASHSNSRFMSRWHPLYILVECFFAGFTRTQGPLKQRKPHISKQMYNLQRVIDQVMKNQLALEQLEHGIDFNNNDTSMTITPRSDGHNATVTTTAATTPMKTNSHSSTQQQNQMDVDHGEDNDDRKYNDRDINNDDNSKNNNDINDILEKRIIERLQSNHQYELELLAQQHEQSLSQLTRQYDEINKRFQRKHQQDLDRIEQNYKQQLNDQEQDYQQRLTTVEEQLANEGLRKRQLELLVRENGDEIKKITAELVNQHDQVATLESKLKYRPPVHHATIQTDEIEDHEKESIITMKEQLKQQEEKEGEYKQQLQKLQRTLDDQEEKWQQKIAFYRHQVDTRMQQFYEQEYMVTRLQDHLQIVKEHLDQKEQQENLREQQLLEWMNTVQQLRDEKKELLSRLLRYQHQFQHTAATSS